jgi:hypothetical protein
MYITKVIGGVFFISGIASFIMIPHLLNLQRNSKNLFQKNSKNLFQKNPRIYPKDLPRTLLFSYSIIVGLFLLFQ